MAVNDIAHKQMVQEALKARFGSHKRLLCKANIQYPVQAEREFQRVTNGYMRILNETLKNHLPEIRDAARIEREANRRHDSADDLTNKLPAMFDTIGVVIERKSAKLGVSV